VVRSRSGPARLLLALGFGVLFLAGAGAQENPLVLRQRLHDAVVGQRVFTYAQVWHALEVLDAIPGQPGRLRLIYTRRAEDVRRRDHGQNDPDSWNREHLWPKSHGFPDPEDPAYTDLNNLRPADRSVNTDRNDRDYDDGGRPHREASLVNWDRDSWEVPDEVKGDVARAIFYMALRYDGTGTWSDKKGVTHPEPRLEVIDGDSPEDHEPLFGHRQTLLRWNRIDPPDDAERARNAGVEALQGKRNPFVDHPEFIELLWGVPAGP